MAEVAILLLGLAITGVLALVKVTFAIVALTWLWVWVPFIVAVVIVVLMHRGDVFDFD